MVTSLKPMITIWIGGLIADFGSVFFSLSGLNSSIRTAWLNRRRARDHWVLPGGGSWEDGFAPVALQPNHHSVRNVFNFVLHNAVSRTSRFDPRVPVAAEAMIADCKWHGVECRFFLSPLHADVLYALYHLNLWPEVEKLKRTLATLAPTYDFTRYNHLIDERTGPVVYWPEAFHFAPALGELVAKAMTGVRTADMPDNFGAMLLTRAISRQVSPPGARSATAGLHSIRTACSACERRRRTFEMASRSKAVTDAELRAGGW